MTDELYDLYKRDPDFRHYVDSWCKKHNIGLFEAVRINILQEYGKYIRENKKS